MADAIFVFGSNEAGDHAGGAARFAHDHRGAEMRVALGLRGQSFALPTMDSDLRRLPLSSIESYVTYFIEFARSRPDLTFQVTQIGCGIAGFKASEMAPLFAKAPSNCAFDIAWRPWLGERTYWGTYA
jgi:hypothetical protein